MEVPTRTPLWIQLLSLHMAGEVVCAITECLWNTVVRPGLEVRNIWSEEKTPNTMTKRFEICSRKSSYRVSAGVLITVLTKILLNLTITKQRCCTGALEPLQNTGQCNCACSLLSASILSPALLKKSIFQCETYLPVLERRCESNGISKSPNLNL